MTLLVGVFGLVMGFYLGALGMAFYANKRNDDAMSKFEKAAHQQIDEAFDRGKNLDENARKQLYHLLALCLWQNQGQIDIQPFTKLTIPNEFEIYIHENIEDNSTRFELKSLTAQFEQPKTTA
jgi:hypothetical protein